MNECKKQQTKKQANKRTNKQKDEVHRISFEAEQVQASMPGLKQIRARLLRAMEQCQAHVRTGPQ